MKKYTLPLIALLLVSFSSDGFTRCFLDSESFDSVHTRLKTQVICSNAESLKVCHDLVIAQSIEKEVTTQKSCDVSDVQVASTVPLTTPVIASLKVLSKGINEALGRKTYVNGVVDFHQHTIMHKKRVTQLAVELAQKFPKEFKGLSTDLIIRVLSKHDNAKIKPQYTYGKSGPFYETLYKYYGKKPPMDVISKLNKIDTEIMEAALKKEGLGLEFSDTKSQILKKIALRKKILKLEKLADFVDRGMSEVSPEEFGRKMWKESSVAKTQLGKKMALFLENNYEKLVGHLKYKKLSSKDYFFLAQKIKTDKHFKTILNSGRTIKEMSIRSLDGMAKVISSRAQSQIAKVGGSVLLGSSLVLDAVLLATYSPSMGCTSMPGHHDWDIINGKCTPISGLTEKFISYLSLPERTQKEELLNGTNMCKVLSDNNKMNEENIFTQISCSPGGARLEVASGKSMYVNYDFDGNITKIHLKRLSSYIGGVIGKKYNELKYNKDGKLVELCSPSNIGITTCRKPNTNSTLNHTNNITSFISSMNYKIQQGSGCCLGIKNEFNKNIVCTI
jgi:hypothetical protein